jgi:hypothetical protein
MRARVSYFGGLVKIVNSFCLEVFYDWCLHSARVVCYAATTSAIVAIDFLRTFEVRAVMYTKIWQRSNSDDVTRSSGVPFDCG